MEYPRWTIDELTLRYELEPALEDVFVEGQFDHDIIMMAYRHSEVSMRTVYTADVVDVTDEVYEAHHMTRGNKQALIVLCRQLAGVNANGRVRFIVDRDTDHWFGDLEQCPGLVWTEYCDIENYFYDEAFFRELIVDAGKARIADWAAYYKSFCSVLKQLYAVRVVLRQCGIVGDFVDFKRCLALVNGAAKLDIDEYIIRTLNNSGVGKRREECALAVASWLDAQDGDCRLACRGHDFVTLVSWSILKQKGEKAMSDVMIERILVLLVPRDAGRFGGLL